MFEVLEVSVEMVEAVGVVEAIERRDGDLARQVRRAASSVVLNVAEGHQRAGKDRQHCFRIAAGSANEVRAALRVARAWRYAGADAQPALALLDRVVAMLWRLTH
jgi:four helix bundle protein